MARLCACLTLALALTVGGMRMKVAQEVNATSMSMETILGRVPPPRNWSDSMFRPPDIDYNWQAGRMKGHVRDHFGSQEPQDMLVPALVAPPGSWYQFRVKEKTRIVETNEYEWELEEANGLMLNWRIAKLEGKWTSSTFGHKTVQVLNPTGKEIFKIRNNKYAWNPFQRRSSWRILPPHSTDSADAWYTINKDKWGRGILWMKDEWRIYRGRERDNDMAYYCVGSYFGMSWWFYRNKRAYDAGEEAIAEISQKWNAGAFGAKLAEEFAAGLVTWLPDKFKLRIKDGEDSALLMAVATIIDIANDSDDRR